MNIKLTLEFDGTNYAGWQKQPNALTLQEVVETALSKIFEQKIPVIGCGRTDAGVHAKEFVINFKYPKSTIPIKKIPNALNQLLPEDISAKKAEKTNPDFHATFSAKKKTYRYTILNNEHRSVFDKNYYHQESQNLNIAKMKKSAKIFVGKHDFRSFCSEANTKNNCVRTIKKITIKQEQNYIYIDITANGFLYNMVRIIAGTLIKVGKGKLTCNNIKEIFKNKNRIHAGPTAPAKGLCLIKLYY
ncbi:tRNA pseudouridine(38-40) synthase TruA [bacterium]|nr:tRNA pseudouridine(38-40) synthase TruA [bacterium]